MPWNEILPIPTYNVITVERRKGVSSTRFYSITLLPTVEISKVPVDSQGANREEAGTINNGLGVIQELYLTLHTGDKPSSY